MRVVRETNNLVRLTRIGMVNCFLVAEEDGLTLVDTNLPGSVRSILNAAQSLRAPIRRILLTHAHVDHVGSVDALLRELPGIEFNIGLRESRLLKQDFSLDADEAGKPLWGFSRVNSVPTRALVNGDRIGSLQAISSPGHTPGHMAFLDVRDGSLIAGDAFTTQMGVTAAGVFKFYFPFPALFSWNRELATESAKRLRSLNPARLAVGHGNTIVSPLRAMDQAIEMAFRQSSRRN